MESGIAGFRMAGWNQDRKSENFGVPMNLKQINLGVEGLDYVTSCLRGWPGLCSRIVRELERGGDVFTPLPAETSLERALQFKAGGLISWRETCLWFERELERLSGRTDNGSLVLPDLVARPQDPVLAKYDRVFFDQSSVYYILGPHDLNAAAISLTMSQVSSFLFVAVFCNFSFSTADVPTTRILDENLLDEMVNNAQEVFVSAYDREGLVVWRKNQQSAASHS